MAAGFESETIPKMKTPPKRLSNYVPVSTADAIGDSDAVEMGRRGGVIWLRLAGGRDVFVKDGKLVDASEYQ